MALVEDSEKNKTSACLTMEETNQVERREQGGGGYKKSERKLAWVLAYT